MLLGASAMQPVIAPLPDGIYQYTVIDSGQPSATSAVRVSRSGGNLVIEEHASPMEENESSRRTLDPSTFALRSYTDASDGKPYFTLTVNGNTATALREGAPPTAISALPRAPFIVFDYFIGAFFHLPATLHGAPTSALSLVVLGGDTAELLIVSAASGKRPAGVPAIDASTAVILDGATVTLWYDPATFVLDECDLPAARIVYKRISTRY
jgi:hypothetical protein